MTPAIEVRGVGRAYRRFRPDRPWTLQEAILRGLSAMRPADRHWALRDISFSVARGQMVGILGANGAGKSTLLRLVGGVGMPDEGDIIVRGRIGALLDLGAGFHPDLTGRENVMISGIISGLLRREVRQQFDSIVDFAELEDFIDSPLRTYSSGMMMRLAFAVAVHIRPEILLIDEVLGVGDIAFQNKCLERIKLFKQRGCTILLVTHNPRSVAQLCDEALWLGGGRLIASGAAAEVTAQYVEAMTGAPADAEAQPAASPM